jgi:2-dehydro-3-deoxygalactonokinase
LGLTDGTLIAKAVRPVGVRSTAITGNTAQLKQAIAACWQEALTAARLSPQDVKAIVASGMITSNLGLEELPHLPAPVGLTDLKAQLVERFFPDVLPFPIKFVRGVKNPQIQLTGEEDFIAADFMRGEETQVIGIIELLQPVAPFSFVSLGSHTKLIGVDDKQRILGSVTTLGGELFAALMERTAIGNSLPKEPIEPDRINMALVQYGYTAATKFGLTRALFMPRVLDLLFNTSPQDRLSFIEGALTAADFQCFSLARRLGLALERLIITGPPLRVRVFCQILDCLPDPKPEVQHLAPQDMDRALITAAAKLALF